MPSTLVSTLDIHSADRVARRKITGFRTSHGDVGAYNLTTFQLALGETQTFEFNSFFYGYVRDVLDITINDGTNSVTFKNRVGVVSFPGNGTITFSVPADSLISLERQIQVVYS